jgi:hypothetical protein
MKFVDFPDKCTGDDLTCCERRYAVDPTPGMPPTPGLPPRM